MPASITSIQLGVLPTTTATRSPGRTPCSRSRAAQEPAPSASLLNVHGSITPSEPRYMSARRRVSSASASTTSRVKLKRSGTRQRPSAHAGWSAASSGPRVSWAAARLRRPKVTSFTTRLLSTGKRPELRFLPLIGEEAIVCPRLVGATLASPSNRPGAQGEASLAPTGPSRPRTGCPREAAPGAGSRRPPRAPRSAP